MVTRTKLATPPSIMSIWSQRGRRSLLTLIAIAGATWLTHGNFVVCAVSTSAAIVLARLEIWRTAVSEPGLR